MGLRSTADRLGMKHLGVTPEEYGDRLSYRIHTLLDVASHAVRRALGISTHVSQTNLDRSLAIPDQEKGDK